MAEEGDASAGDGGGVQSRSERVDIVTRKTSQFWEEYQWAGC